MKEVTIILPWATVIPATRPQDSFRNLILGICVDTRNNVFRCFPMSFGVN